MRMFRGTYLAAALMIFLVPSHSIEPLKPRFPTPKITPLEWRKFLQEVKGTEGVECRELPLFQLKCSSESLMTIWVFTRPGHAAHPAVTRGVMLIENSSDGTRLAIDRSGHFAGPESPFAEWMKEFLELDSREMDR